MEVTAVMMPHVRVATPEMSIREIAAKMRDLDIGVLPVYYNGHPIGIITDRDITTRVTARGIDPETTLVTEMMSSPVVCCSEHQSVEEAAVLMEENGIRRLVVLKHDGRLAGIISLDDLASHVGTRRLVGEVLKPVVEKEKMEIAARMKAPPEDDVWF